jgi:hypothetical protein
LGLIHQALLVERQSWRVSLEQFLEWDETGFDGIVTGSNNTKRIGVRHQLKNKKSGRVAR